MTVGRDMLHLMGLDPPPGPHLVSAAVGGVLFVVLVLGVILGWRWFDAHSAALAAGAERLRKRLIATKAAKHLAARYPRIWKFFSARFARGEYLGLHLTVGFVISFVGLWLFVAITEDVIEGDPITKFDVRVLSWMNAHATPVGYKIFQAISFLATPEVMTVIIVIVGVALAKRREWFMLAGWTFSILGGGALDWILKALIRRPRPSNAERFLTHVSWSFPSGHSMSAFVGYAMLAYALIVLTVHRRTARMALVFGTVVVILAVGLSRIYLGVHYFSDVVGAYAVGLLWVSTCISGLEVVRRWRARGTPPAVGNG
ncbi:MAG: phosphatase PAP2 family protein [Gemmatimonadota bacterium]